MVQTIYHRGNFRLFLLLRYAPNRTAVKLDQFYPARSGASIKWFFIYAHGLDFEKRKFDLDLQVWALSVLPTFCGQKCCIVPKVWLNAISMDQKLNAIDGAELFRRQLQNELLKRCKANPSYSLRAFARSLQVDFSTLSKILQGQRKLGPKALTRLGGRLGMGPSEIQAFILKNKSEAGVESYQQLAIDAFEVISDWYHFAILELMRVKNFKADPQWVASRLGLTVAQTRIAIERLERVGMIEISSDSKSWKDISQVKTTVIPEEVSSIAHRNLQKQILQQAIQALEYVPLSLRDQTSMTLAVDVKKLPEAKLRIKKFRRSLAKFLSRGSPCGEVYHLGISLYPVTKSEKKVKEI